MFSNVSWKEYIGAMALLLAVYYLFIGIRYYRRNLLSLLSGRFHRKQHSSDGDTDNDELDSIVFDIRYAILEKASMNASKQELLRQLCERLENYSGLRKPAFRVALSNAIIQQAKDNCNVDFSMAELDDAWDWIAPRR